MPKKDKIPNTSGSNILTEFTCPVCNSSYVGKTEGNLTTRLSEPSDPSKISISKHLSECEHANYILNLNPTSLIGNDKTQTNRTHLILFKISHGQHLRCVYTMRHVACDCHSGVWKRLPKPLFLLISGSLQQSVTSLHKHLLNSIRQNQNRMRHVASCKPAFKLYTLLNIPILAFSYSLKPCILNTGSRAKKWVDSI